MPDRCRYVAQVRRVPLLLVLGVLLVVPAAPAARADTFTVVPSAAALPTPLEAPTSTPTRSEIRTLSARHAPATVPRSAAPPFVPPLALASPRLATPRPLLSPT